MFGPFIVTCVPSSAKYLEVLVDSPVLNTKKINKNDMNNIIILFIV